MKLRRLGVLLAGASLAVAAVAVAGLGTGSASTAPDFGPNVHIFSPTMDQAAIQSELNSIAVAQVHNEFGTRRDAVLFEPGTYGTAAQPLIFQVGYYTTVAGLGLSPDDVHIKGLVEVPNQCGPNGCLALTNFWRSLSNLTIDVDTSGPSPLPPAATAPESPGCVSSNDLYAVSQAAPIRRVVVNGLFFLFDYCGPKDFASGGFIADSKLGVVINATQQQWITRNSSISVWTNAVWNQVFSGVAGAPAQSFPNPPFTTVPVSPVTREAPFLYLDSTGAYQVFVPAVGHNTSGTSWGSGSAPGRSIPLSHFFIAQPTNSVDDINNALDNGLNLLLTPGVYHLTDAIQVQRPARRSASPPPSPKSRTAVVIGLGMPTLINSGGNPAVDVGVDVGVIVSGILLEAGPEQSDVLLLLGHGDGDPASAADPSGLYDVFFRIGGAAVGKTKTALVVDSNNAILDDIWAWRADHGNGVGWTSNTADTGVIVNGDNVTAYGLFVEHFQKFEVIWNGNNGTDVFFQNEMPYDVPSQSAWMEAPGVNGFAAFKIGDGVTNFTGYGMGSYSFFNKGIAIFADHAFEAPASLQAGSLHDLFTIFLDKVNGSGGITHVVNETGGSSTAANADAVVPVVSFP